MTSHDFSNIDTARVCIKEIETRERNYYDLELL